MKKENKQIRDESCKIDLELRQLYDKLYREIILKESEPLKPHVRFNDIVDFEKTDVKAKVLKLFNSENRVPIGVVSLTLKSEFKKLIRNNIGGFSFRDLSTVDELKAQLDSLSKEN